MKLRINDQEMREYFTGLKQFFQQKDRGLHEQREHCEEEWKQVRKALREELFSEKFARFLEQHSGCNTVKSFWQVVESYRNQLVWIGTDAGSIQGLLVEVGEDYAAVEESGGTQVILAVRQIISIQAI